MEYLSSDFNEFYACITIAIVSAFAFASLD